MKEMIIIKNSTEKDWYYELNGKIVPFEKEDDKFYYLNIRGEINRIPKIDANKVEPVELELPDDVINNIDEFAKKLKMTRDEFVNYLLTNYLKGKK